MKFELIYDGQCPLCSREIAFLRRRDRQGRLSFQDLHDPAFSPESIGKTTGELMAQIHGVFEDGQVITGVAVFREAYRRVGLGWLLAPTAWPLMRPLSNWLYRHFAKNRMRIGHLFGRAPEAESKGGESCEQCAHFGRE